MTQQEYMKAIKNEFLTRIMSNGSILHDYCYCDKRATKIIENFKSSVKELGLKISNCYNAHGIGNNNEYKIFIEERDDEGFVIQKNIAELYYCYGIYGGVYVRLKDLATNKTLVVGKAR